MARITSMVHQLDNSDGIPTNNLNVCVRDPPLSDLPDHVYVTLCREGESDESWRYERAEYCNIRLMPMSGWHCSRCGELVTLYDGNDMLRRVRFCPCCGAHNMKYGLD